VKPQTFALLIDDNLQQRAELRDSLRRQGYEARSFASTRALLLFLHDEAEQPGVIFLNTSVPTGDVEELLKARASQPRLAAVPVIGISNSGEQVPARLAAALEGQLCRPLGPEMLIQAIQSLPAVMVSFEPRAA
jgi:DNA-binding NarL/FixJ family response regulator